MKSIKLALGAATALLASSTFTAQTFAQAEPYIGEIKGISFGFCPRNYAEAAGQLLAISSYDALFSLYGTTYGGDGRTTFGLPDLRDRFSTTAGSGAGLSSWREGQIRGSDTMALVAANLPSHNHQIAASRGALNSNTLDGNSISEVSGFETYATTGTLNQNMNPAIISNTGNNQSFHVSQPYLSMRYCVALVGIYPSRN